VYGPKYLATREYFTDIALESRCLTSEGEENRTKKPLFRWKKFQSQSLALRNKLILWRFRHYQEFKEKVDKIEDPNLVQEVCGEDFEASSRVKQVTVPLALISDETFRKTLKTIASNIDETLKELDKDYQLEVDVKDALRDLLEEYGERDELGEQVYSRGDMFQFKLKDIAVNIIGEGADSKQINAVTQRISRFFNRRKLSIIKGTAKRDRSRRVYIPCGHALLNQTSAPSNRPVHPGPPVPPPQSAGQKCLPLIEPPKPPPVPVPVPVPEDQQEDWKAGHPDFFTGAKQPLKKRHGTVDVCYTCWMAPKNKYQQMLTAGTIRWEPIKPTGEYMCQLCGKEPAGYRVIV